MICSEFLRERGILVDRFGKPRSSSADFLYFASHAHRDHLSGLRKGWKRGTVNCSEASGKLLKILYGEDLPIRTWRVGAWSRLGSLDIACIHAHHCIGSVMWLFRFEDGFTAVHTGDYRMHPDILEWPHWPSKVDLLLLDSTYNNPNWHLPSWKQSTDALERIYQQIPPNQQMLIRVHSIGLEEWLAGWLRMHNRHVMLHHSLSNVIRTAFEQSGCVHHASSRIVLVSSKYNHPGSAKDVVYVKPSCLYFIVHRFREVSVQVNENFYRIWFTFHASYAENEQLANFLHPTQIQSCVEMPRMDPKDG